MQSVGQRCELMFLVSMALFICSCAAPAPRDVPGRYTITTEWFESTLVLRQDHTMTQVVTPTGSPVKQLSGTWTYQDGLLTLSPCYSLRWGSEGLYAGGCTASMGGGPFGPLEVSTDGDKGLHYVRVGDPQ